MSDNTPNPVVVNVKNTTDFTEAAIVVVIFLSTILCLGEPGLLDALISYLLRA